MLTAVDLGQNFLTYSKMGDKKNGFLFARDWLASKPSFRDVTARDRCKSLK